jgi:uncharacterized protein Usg
VLLDSLHPAVHDILQLFPDFEQLTATHFWNHYQVLTPHYESFKPFEGMHMTHCFGSINSSKHSCVLATAVGSSKRKSVLACCSMTIKETTIYVYIAATDEHIELEFFSLFPGGHNMKHNKLATYGFHTDHTYTTTPVLQFS